MFVQSFLVAASLICPTCGVTNSQESLPKSKEWQRKLLSMAAEDQRARIRMGKSLNEACSTIGSKSSTLISNARSLFSALLAQSHVAQIDAKNQSCLKEFVAIHGWPGTTLVGADGAGAAWLIAQHADNDLPFQKECLAMMEGSPVSEVNQSHIAYLTDRVLVAEKKSQRFGTQMGPNFTPLPIEDEKHVDQLRAAKGLNPLAEYIATAKEQYAKLMRKE